jgi:hypothetical protein
MARLILREADMRVLLTVLLVTICAASPAIGETYPNALVFDSGYASGPSNWDPWNNWPEIGDPLQIVGAVSQINAPFTGRVLPPTYELTYAYTGFLCTGYGMWDDFENNQGGPFAQFGIATLTVYLDDTPDASIADPGTFLDGEAVLVATTTYDAWIYDGNPDESFGVGVRFTGGSWFDDVSSNGTGWLGYNSGLFNPNVSPALEILGYIGEITAALNVVAPISTQETTWGSIKALYR